MKFNADGTVSIIETVTLGIENPIQPDINQDITEAMLADVKLDKVKAIYPLTNMINSGRLTRNYTFYQPESLMGSDKPGSWTGYSSFIKPYGKPVITEHRSQDTPERAADIPLGRMIAATYMVNKETQTPHPKAKNGYPGSIEGNGTLKGISAITDPAGIRRILGHQYETVSIGSKSDSMVESISGKNYLELIKKGEQLPAYVRGQEYNGKLSYFTIGPIEGREISYVNVPSDERARTIVPDVGKDGIKLLVGEKPLHKTNEFCFFDAKTQEKLEWNFENYAIDLSYFADSMEVGENIWWINGISYESEIQESSQITEGSMVVWGNNIGKIASVYTEGEVPGIPLKLVASKDCPIARIEVYKDGKPSGKFVGHRLSVLKLNGE